MSLAILFYISYIYIQRLFQKGIIKHITFYNAHRIIAITILLAIKNHDDFYCSNYYYASVSGIHPMELNRLEECFLHNIEWDLIVNIGSQDDCAESIRSDSQSDVSGMDEDL